jgi:hypothetical protein
MREATEGGLCEACGRGRYGGWWPSEPRLRSESPEQLGRPASLQAPVKVPRGSGPTVREIENIREVLQSRNDSKEQMFCRYCKMKTGNLLRFIEHLNGQHPEVLAKILVPDEGLFCPSCEAPYGTGRLPFTRHSIVSHGREAWLHALLANLMYDRSYPLPRCLPGPRTTRSSRSTVSYGAPLVPLKEDRAESSPGGIRSDDKGGPVSTNVPARIEAKCPHCGKRARSIDEIEDRFGFRVLGGKNVPQSWCRDCRSTSTNR